MASKKISDRERDEARDQLREMLGPRDEVTMLMRHVSSSGMSRTFSIFVAVLDHQGKPTIRDISWLVHRATGLSWDSNRGGVKVTGCGMDMSFYTANALSCALTVRTTDGAQYNLRRNVL